MMTCHRKLWKCFEDRGFTWGKNQLILNAFLEILTETEKVVHKVITEHGSHSKDWEIVLSDCHAMESRDPTFVVVFNTSYLPPRFKLEHYELHSFVSFEEIGMDEQQAINHFMTWAPTSQVQIGFVGDECRDILCSMTC